ncbi:uncharacterized protein JCM6883_004538 [Sporobolomyces salmoneus]|uniref:uncharacterized protein n=1 Tax=Sporobolomyces salmoneus TaxID=183962 RepID=UPI00316BEBAD
MAPRPSAQTLANERTLYRRNNNAIGAPIRIYQTLFANTDGIFNATASQGTLTEVYARWLEEEEGIACAGLVRAAQGRDNFTAILVNSRNSLENLGPMHFNFPRLMPAPKSGRVGKSWTEVDDRGNRVAKKTQYPILPLLPKVDPPTASFRRLCRVNGARVLPGYTYRFVMLGHFESGGTNGAVNVGALRTLWNGMEHASKLLIKKYFEVDNFDFDFDHRVCLPRHEGIPHKAVCQGDELDAYLLAVGLSKYMIHVSPTFTTHLTGLIRVDDWLPQLLSSRIPDGNRLFIHCCEASLIITSLKTFAAIAFEYRARTGGSGRKVIMTFGVLAESGGPALEINPTLRDQLFHVSFSELAMMWDSAKHEVWPLSVARLIEIGLEDHRARIVNVLSRMVGSKESSYSMGASSRDAPFPGLNI